MIRAITFDFWNTLMFESPLGTLREHRLAYWARELPGADPDALAAAHDAAHATYVAAWKDGRQYVVEDAAADMAQALGGDVPVATLLDGFGAGSAEANIELCAGAETCLNELRERGVGIGIVCDIGLTPSDVLLDLLARRGLGHLFDAPVFSDQVGIYKPDAGIFDVALDRLGVDATEAAHIGDRLRTDVLGARERGMRSIRYTAVFDDPAELPEADAVLDDLEQVPRALEEMP